MDIKNILSIQKYGIPLPIIANVQTYFVFNHIHIINYNATVNNNITSLLYLQKSLTDFNDYCVCVKVKNILCPRTRFENSGGQRFGAI